MFERAFFRTALVTLALQVSAVTAAETARPVALVTGSSSGLGAELVQIAAERDMRLVLVDKDPGPSEAFAEAYRAAGGDAVVFTVDLGDADARADLVQRTVDAFGRIDYLFNNAGYSYLATTEQMDLEAAHALFEVNYWAYADLVAQAIPLMREQGGGTLVNIASILGVRPAPPGLGHYAATKHALLGLLQTTAQEVADDNIRVFVAAPAGMATNIGRNAVGPLADSPGARSRADDWEDPAVPAADIFRMIEEDETVIYPGYIGRTASDQ